MKLYIGEQLKTLRKEKRITQETLADVLGVSYQSVSRWAWFDSVRNTEKYREAVAWAEAEVKKEDAE